MNTPDDVKNLEAALVATTVSSRAGGGDAQHGNDAGMSQRTSLPPTIMAALQIFLETERRHADSTEWYSLCTRPHPATVFFNGTRNSALFRRTACDAVADVYHDLLTAVEVPIINPKFVYKVRDKAESIRAILPAHKYLPSEVNTNEFRSGLDALCAWAVPVCAPTSKSGDPYRRSATLALARKFADAFGEIPVEYVHYLITLGWPGASLSATRRVLPLSTTNQIKRDSKEFRERDQVARSSATLAIQAASTRRRALSDSDRETISDLRDQIDRLNCGKSRFSTDAARLRQLREISTSLDDRELSSDLLHFIDINSKDFIG